MRRGFLLIDAHKNTVLIHPIDDKDEFEPWLVDAFKGDLRKTAKAHQTQGELIADIKKYLKQEYVEGAES